MVSTALSPNPILHPNYDLKNTPEKNLISTRILRRKELLFHWIKKPKILYYSPHNGDRGVERNNAKEEEAYLTCVHSMQRYRLVKEYYILPGHWLLHGNLGTAKSERHGSGGDYSHLDVQEAKKKSIVEQSKARYSTKDVSPAACFQLPSPPLLLLFTTLHLNPLEYQHSY